MMNQISTETSPGMDLVSIIYAFMLTTGTGQFVVNDSAQLAEQLYEVDVETMGLRENKRYIILVDKGHITQQVQVPLTETECKNPH